MSEPKKSLLQRVPLFMSILVLVAAGYTGWIFYSRHKAAAEAQRQAAAREIEQARKDVALNGGSQLKILALYASPGIIHKGESVQLCYGVANAKNVTLTPAEANVWPSHERCVDVKPAHTTTYTLLADDGAGHSDKAEVQIKVQ